MDNSNDKTNQTDTNALDRPVPSEIEPVEEENSEDKEPTEHRTAMTQMELESLIQRYMDDVEKLKSNLKSEKEMYNASFENDAAYSEANEVAKDAKKKVAEIKQNISQQESVKESQLKMSEIKDEMKDVKDAISGLAEQYQQVSGMNQIVQEDGQVLVIERNFKVKRKKG